MTICFFELRRERQNKGYVSLDRNVKVGETERGEKGFVSSERNVKREEE